MISQFTLAGDLRKGRRPSFTSDAPPAEGERLYHYFCDQLRALEVPVQTGEFGAMKELRSSERHSREKIISYPA